MKPARDADTPQRILDCAEATLRRSGLAGLSMGPLAEAVGVRKPSLFHHFRDKNALTLAVVERFSTRFMIALDRVVESKASGRTKLRRLIDLFAAGLVADEQRQGSLMICLCGALTGDLDELDEKTRTAVRAYFEQLEARSARILAQGVEEGSLHLEGSPAATARTLVALLEGAHLSARAHGDPEVFRVVVRQYEKQLSNS